MGLRKFLDKIEHNFEKGGRYREVVCALRSSRYLLLSPRQCHQNHGTCA